MVTVIAVPPYSTSGGAAVDYNIKKLPSMIINNIVRI